MHIDFSNEVMPFMQDVQKNLQKDKQTQEKLEEITKLLKTFFKADAAAFYTSIDENYLAFFSGDRFESPDEQGAIRLGEGFIGRVGSSARILTLNDGTKKPFAAQIAAPLIQWEKVVGAVWLGFYRQKEFDEQMIEKLKTLAMFLTTVFASEEIAAYKRKFAKSQGLVLKDRIKGYIVNKGYGVGSAVVHKRARSLSEIFSKDIKNELTALHKAKEAMLEEIDEKIKHQTFANAEHIEILETYKLLAQDKGWYKKITDGIQTGLTAAAAIEKVYDDMREKLSYSDDVYLKERLNDLRDISDRLRNHLNGGTKEMGQKKDIVIVAESMGPADLTDYDYQNIRALILEDATSTMHVSIVAKALNIPLISKIKGLYRNVKEGEILAVDGENGFVYVNPTEQMKSDFAKKQKKMSDWRKELKQIAQKPTTTADRHKINLYINVGLDVDLEYLTLSNCDGVGLYRTEIYFMTSEKMPSVAEQIASYKKLLEKAKTKPVVFRSLDVGSDKLLPYWGEFKEQNPAIGWRSIRITLDRRALLRQQMRAFLRAAAGRELYVMFPMISTFEEFMDAKKTLMLEYEKQKQAGLLLPLKIKVGLMIEVPSVVFELDEILKEADFISVGTNDLAQFMFASDRTNIRLNERYDVLSAPFLKVMKTIIKKAQQHHKPCSVCGEMASIPIEAMALIGLGYKSFSCSGTSFTAVKKMIKSVHIAQISDYVETLLSSNRKTFRPQLFAYAKDHGIAI